MVVEGREGVGANDAGGDGIADAVEVLDAGDGGTGEHRGGANGGAVRAFVTTEPRFVRRRRGDEFEEHAIANVGDHALESDV